MKKLILIAGLAGILVTGAFATAGPTSSATVNVNIAPYISIGSASGALTFNINDGGYGSSYSATPVTFTVVTNAAWSASVGALTITSGSSNPNYVISGSLTGVTGTKTLSTGTPITLSATTPGGGSAGLVPDSVSGTIVVTVSNP